MDWLSITLFVGTVLTFGFEVVIFENVRSKILFGTDCRQFAYFDEFNYFLSDPCMLQSETRLLEQLT